MLGILRALRDAQAKARDVGERARIGRAMLEVDKRAQRLAAALDRVAAMRATQERYQARISGLGERIEKLVGRNYRGSERWLRRWKSL
jgi:phage host-nuclease inhibitor protein Gam